ncbi:MAG: glycosyltransferase [candidate division KSB1 bacterium]|nr:glycosyltransferase [candidate division KSB1 bacterium]
MLFAHIFILLTVLYCLMILLFLTGLYRNRPAHNPEKLRVSVIIAARNEESYISHVLNDLLNQNYPQELYDITVVDDCSTDRTCEIVKSFEQAHDNIRCIRLENVPEDFSPKKYALEQAVKESKGDIILTTDADCRLAPDWIRGMVRYFAPETAFVIGFSQLTRPDKTYNLIEHLQSFDFLEMMGAAAGTANLGYPLAASGQNMGYRKSVFHKIGGYSRVKHRISGDDVLLLNLIRKYTNHKIAFASHPDTFVFSHPQPTLAALLNQRIRWASNGSYQIQLNFLFFIYLLLVYIFNLMLLIALPLSLLLPSSIPVTLACLASRFIFEGALAMKSVKFFNRRDLLPYFSLWFFAQIPYIIYVGLLGTFGRFKWKERVHSADSGYCP